MNSLGVDPCRFPFIRLLYLHNSEMCKDSGGGRSGYGDPSSSALQMSMPAKSAEWGERKATLECSASYVIFKIKRFACKLNLKQKKKTRKYKFSRTSSIYISLCQESFPFCRLFLLPREDLTPLIGTIHQSPDRHWEEEKVGNRERQSWVSQVLDDWK